MENLDNALSKLAQRLSRELLNTPEVTAVVNLNLSGIVSLGFDRDSELTPESLKQALIENFVNLLENAEAADVINDVHLVEVRHE
jgi:hypothetical protein